MNAIKTDIDNAKKETLIEEGIREAASQTESAASWER